MLNEYVRIVAAFSDPSIATEIKRHVVNERLPYDFLFVSSIADLKKGLLEMKPQLVLSAATLSDGSICDCMSALSDLPVVVLGMPGNEKLAIDALKKGVYDYLIHDLDGDYLGVLPVAIEKALGRFEIQLRNARSAIELAESRSRLEEFTGTAAHDIKGLVHNSITLLEALKLELGSNITEGTQELVTGLESFSRRMWRLVEDLLAYSRVQHRGDSLEPLCLKDLLEQLLAELCVEREATKASFSIQSLPLVLGDRLMLRLLFSNLLRNAMQYHRPGVPPQIIIRGKLNEVRNLYEFHVEDNGTGFDLADAEIIFREFERLDPETNIEGSGLGLAICKRVSQRLGGDIRAESIPGTGSSFIVSLPLKRVVLP